VPVPRHRAIVLAAVKTEPSAALNRAGLDRRCARRHRDRAAGTGECSAGPNQRMWWIAICPVARAAEMAADRMHFPVPVPARC